MRWWELCGYCYVYISIKSMRYPLILPKIHYFIPFAMRKYRFVFFTAWPMQCYVALFLRYAPMTGNLCICLCSMSVSSIFHEIFQVDYFHSHWKQRVYWIWCIFAFRLILRRNKCLTSWQYVMNWLLFYFIKLLPKGQLKITFLSPKRVR